MTTRAQVHVYGSPDEGLDLDERLCSDADSTDRERIRVVYHVHPIPAHQGWRCGVCGEASYTRAGATQ